MNTCEYIPMVSVRLVREGKMKYAVNENMSSPETVYKQFAKLFRHQIQEKLVAVFVNTQLMPMGVQIIGIGTASSCNIDNAAIFRSALLSGATGIILIHNHPSGSLVVSTPDKESTERIIACGKMLGIDVMDHIIVTDGGYLSMRETTNIKFS